MPPSSRFSSTDEDDEPTLLAAVQRTLSRALPRVQRHCVEGWRLFVRTANPTITQNETLSPAELALQAKFESIDYHKPYPAMYMRHLRDTFHAEIRDQKIAAGGGGRAAGRNRTDDRSAFALSGGGGGTAASLQQSSTGEWLQEGSQTARNAASAILEEVTAYDASSKNSTLRWTLHVIIGITVGFLAFLIAYMVGTVEDWRSDQLYTIVVDRENRALGYLLGFLFWIASSTAFVSIATSVIVLFEPAAGGSGIPDVIAYLNGILIPKVMNFRTFVAKTISCIFAVGGGLPVGVEAPLIHLGAIAGAGITQGRSRTLGCQTRLFQAFRNNKDRRDFITAGAACGVSAAFGAPIGGLLFVMEEVSSFWDHSSSGQVFLASMIAFSLITVCNSITNTVGRGYVASSDSLLFEVNVSIPLNLTSIVPSSILGILCGLLAVVFTKMNLLVLRFRRAHIKPHQFRRLLEPVLIGITFSSIMYLLALMPNCVPTRAPGTYNETTDVQPWQTENVSLLANLTCHAPDTYSPMATLTLGMGKSTIRHMFTRRTADEFPAGIIFVYMLVYGSFACYTSGTAVASGLVIPTLVVGSTFGRLFGLALVHAFAKNTNIPGGSYFASESWMDPGVFALIGAGAFFGGISRMTMSISVIMVELSGELHFLLPIMVAIVLAKTVADWLCEPLYHQQLHLDFVPYLPLGIAKEFEQLTAEDVMQREVVTLRMRERTSVILAALKSSHHAFPVVNATVDEQGRQRARFVGLVTREDIHVFLSLPSLEHHAVNSELNAASNGSSSNTTRGGPAGCSDSTSLCSGRPPPAVAAAGVPTAAAPVDVLAPLFDGVSGGSGGQQKLQDVPLQPPAAAATASPGLDCDASLPLSPAGNGSSGSFTLVPEEDGYGSTLPSAVLRINNMSWTDWMAHQTSLFFVIGSKRWHQNWGGGSSGPSQPPAPGATSVPVYSSALALASYPPVLDLALIVNRSPWVVPPYFNLSMTYSSFRSMGLRHMVVIDGDDVRGIITRKELLVNTLKQRLQELHLESRRRHSSGSSGPRGGTRAVDTSGGSGAVASGGVLSQALRSTLAAAAAMRPEGAAPPDCSPAKKQRLLGATTDSNEDDER